MELNFKVLILFLILIPVAITGVTLFYPFALISKKITRPELGSDFEEKIQASEKILKPLPNTGKIILWDDPSKKKTTYSFVYLHGWSATRQELSPVTENLAKNLKANLFMTRLTGHGLGTEGMGTVTTEAMLMDAEEALQVGKKLGEKVILVGMSTGASLALYLADKYPDEIADLILVSPNFRPFRKDALLTRGPFGPLLSRIVVGPYYEFEPKNKEQQKFWTCRYPSKALTEMMNLVDGVRRIDLSRIQTPALFIYTEKDEVVNISFVKQKFLELGSTKKKLLAINSPDHILAGDIINPQNTDLVIQEIQKFLH